MGRGDIPMENSATPDWTSSQANETPDKYIYRIGIYGWRKRCLYLFILLLMVMVIINLALTIWVLKVMDFSIDGMGKLRILQRGLRMEGEAEFLHALYATRIESRKDHPLKIESAQNLTLNARNHLGDITTRLFLGDQKMVSMAAQFMVKNPKGKVLFYAGEDRVEVSADMLKVTGSGGAVFQGSVQTPLVTAEYRSNLKLESPTRSLEIEGQYGIMIESRAGDIHASCLKDLKLQSTGGMIKLDAERIHLEKLPEAQTSVRGKDFNNVYQLCACHNGRLFLAPSDGKCIADIQTCT